MTSVVVQHTRTEVRTLVRPAAIRRRIATCSRTASAREPSSGASCPACRWAAIFSTVTTVSAAGSAASPAKASRARGRGCPALMRPASLCTCGRIATGATSAVASSACSRPAAAERVSRSISVQDAIASIRSTRRAARRSGPSIAGNVNAPAAASAPATGHPVNAPTTTPASAAPPSRGPRKPTGSRNEVKGRRPGSAAWPGRRERPRTVRTAPAAKAAPRAAARGTAAPSTTLLMRTTTDC